MVDLFISPVTPASCVQACQLSSSAFNARRTLPVVGRRIVPSSRGAGRRWSGRRVGSAPVCTCGDRIVAFICAYKCYGERSLATCHCVIRTESSRPPTCDCFDGPSVLSLLASSLAFSLCCTLNGLTHRPTVD